MEKPAYPALAGRRTFRRQLLTPGRCVKFFNVLNSLGLAISLRWGSNLFRQRLLIVLDTFDGAKGAAQYQP